MSNIKFISNNSSTNHLYYILQNFEGADEIWIATAFLKISGLNLLLPAIKKHIKANKPIQIIAGQNFGLTEPQALRTLHDLFISKPNAQLFLDKAISNEQVFHPKLFIFKNGSSGTVLSGSANITKGGLISNNEVSVSIDVTTVDKEWKELNSYFKKITSRSNSEIVNLMVIGRYTQFYLEQKAARSRQKASPEKNPDDYNFTYKKLKERLRTFDKAQFIELSKERKKHYKEAKVLLDEIVESNRLSQTRFEQIIDLLVGRAGHKSLWKSGSLFRHRKAVYNHKTEFKRLVSYIKTNQTKSQSYVFTGAKELVDDIRGARINYVTEIMMTYQPNRFANLNSNPITVLDEEAGVYFKSHSGQYKGKDYEEYCAIIKEICNELGFNDMLEADSFINEIYWKLKKKIAHCKTR